MVKTKDIRWNLVNALRMSFFIVLLVRVGTISCSLQSHPLSAQLPCHEAPRQDGLVGRSRDNPRDGARPGI